MRFNRDRRSEKTKGMRRRDECFTTLQSSHLFSGKQWPSRSSLLIDKNWKDHILQNLEYYVSEESREEMDVKKLERHNEDRN